MFINSFEMSFSVISWKSSQLPGKLEIVCGGSNCILKEVVHLEHPGFVNISCPGIQRMFSLTSSCWFNFVSQDYISLGWQFSRCHEHMTEYDVSKHDKQANYICMVHNFESWFVWKLYQCKILMIECIM